jgi:hypothetical protein
MIYFLYLTSSFQIDIQMKILYICKTKFHMSPENNLHVAHRTTLLN